MTKTEQARRLTSQLKSALDGQDMPLWLELLDRREAAMSEFDEAHRNASAREQEDCRETVAALQAEDREIQNLSECILDNLAREFRDQLGASSFTGIGQEADRGRACLDRKA